MLPLFEASRKVARHVDKLFDRALGRSGVEVYIHPRGTQPNLISQEKFVYVPPGHVANILVNQRNTVLLGQPYGRCRDSYPFRPHPQGPYLRTACYYACLQNAVVNTCGCKSAELSNADEYPNFAYCFSLSKILAAKSPQEIAVALAHVNQSRVCESEILDTDPSHIICEQECPRACEETSYDLDVRLIRWPKRNTIVHHLAEKFMTDLQANNATERFDLYRNHYEFVVNESDPSNFERFNYETLVNELTILNVEMKSGDLTVTSEAPDYSLYQLLSDIGGQLGLWIGMSVITVTEILELILDLTKLAIKRCTESSAPRRMSTNSASIS